MSTRRLRVSDQIAEQLREQILLGKRDAGQRLPSERALAEAFGVNRASVRGALKILEKDRLVSIQHGGAAVVADFRREGGLNLLSHLLHARGLLDLPLLDELLEARRSFCREVVRIAASCCDQAGARSLRRMDLEAAENARDIDLLQKLDFDYYYQLAQIGQNRVLAFMLNNMRSLYMSYRGIFRAIYWDTERYLRARRQITDAVVARDEALATVLADRLLSVSTAAVT